MGIGKPIETKEKVQGNFLGNFVRKGVELLTGSTRKQALNVLQTEKKSFVDLPTIITPITGAEKGELQKVLDIDGAVAQWKDYSLSSEPQDFVLGGVPFQVRYLATDYNSKFIRTEITCPMDPVVHIQSDFDTDERVMHLKLAYTGMLKERDERFGSTLVRTLFRTINMVVIENITNTDSRTMSRDGGLADKPDYEIKSRTSLIGMLGSEFICKLIDNGKEAMCIRVGKKLQQLLKETKKWYVRQDKEAARKLYIGYMKYINNADENSEYNQLNPEAQEMCRVQRDALAKELSTMK